MRKPHRFIRGVEFRLRTRTRSRSDYRRSATTAGQRDTVGHSAPHEEMNFEI